MTAANNKLLYLHKEQVMLPHQVPTVALNMDLFRVS